nr:unnamed protein product [Haemonchus contortus]
MTLPQHIPGKIHSYSSSTGTSFIAMSDRSASDDGSDREPAKGGKGGLSCHELFLVIVGILLLAFGGVRLFFNFDYATVAHTVGLAILAFLLIFGVCTKSSMCMLIAMIFLIISLILQTVFLAYFAIEFIGLKKELTTRTIASLVFDIICYVFYILVCISTVVLRKQY